MKINQIAITLYTVRDFCQNEKDLFESLKKIKNIGYSSVQISGVGLIDPKTIKRMCEDLSLVICATHEPNEQIINNTDGIPLASPFANHPTINNLNGEFFAKSLMADRGFSFWCKISFSGSFWNKSKFVNTIIPIQIATHPINVTASNSEYPNLEATAGMTPAINMPTKTNISLIEVILVRSS